MYLLGDHFVLDPKKREFFARDQRVDLGVRGFDLLLHLVEHRDRTLRKKDIFRLVWGLQVVVEDNLYVQVSRLRNILGKRAIATIPGQGYRFVMDTRLASADAVHLPLPGPDLPAASQSLRDDSGTLRLGLIGRERELGEVLVHLERQALLTLAGPGGIGKTSLAMTALQQLQQTSGRSCVVVDLSVIDASASALQSLTQALQIPFTPGAQGLESACMALEERRSLLLLDNAEHVLGQVRELVSAISATTRRVNVCITSRVPLRLDGELVYRVPSLLVPGRAAAPEEASRFGAVELFVRVAQEGFSNFQLDEDNVALVSDVCRHLDGLPLALKLAARRLPTLGIRDLHSRLSSMMNLLGHRLPASDHRHETMAATLAWSIDALDEVSRDLLQIFGVFSGSFSLAQACAIGATAGHDEWQVIDGLDRLIDHSLVFLIEGGESRYRLLEVTRAFVLDQLRQHGRLDTLLKAHAGVMDEVLAQGVQDFWTLSESELQEKYRGDMDNARSALAWCRVHEPARAVRMTAGWFRLFGGLLEAMAQTRRQFDALEHLLGPEVPTDLQAGFWLTRAASLIRVDDARVHDYAGRAAALYEQIGDCRGLFEAQAWYAASLTCELGEAQSLVNDFEHIDMSGWPTRLKMLVQYAACIVHQRQGRFADALQANARMLQFARMSGARSWIERGLFQHHCCLYLNGELEAAIAAAQTAPTQSEATPSTMSPLLTLNFAVSQILQGRMGLARQKVEHFIHQCRAYGRPWSAPGPVVFALLLTGEGRWHDAALIIGHLMQPERRSQGEMPIARHVMSNVMRELQAHLPAPEMNRLFEAGAQLSETEVEQLVMRVSKEASA